MATSEPATEYPRHAVASDIFVLEDADGIRRTLNLVCLAMLVGALALAALAAAVGWQRTFLTAASSAAGFAGVVILLRRGYPRLGGLLALAVLLVGTVFALYDGDGLHDVGIVLLPMIVVVGSVLLNTRAFAVLVVLVLAAVAVLGWFDLTGRQTNKFSGLWTVADIGVLMVILTCAAVIIRALAMVVNRSLARAYRSERNYREIFNATSEAIFIHAADGSVLDVNDTTLAMFGYDREEMVNLSVGDISGRGTRFTAELAARMIQRATREGPQVFEWLARDRDGREFWVEIALRGTKIGGEGRVLAAVRDIDQRKRMEDRLRQSEKLEAVGKLAGGVAHDFNNQLSGIMGFADLLRTRAGDDRELADGLESILTSARRAADLTRQLLAFARQAKYESVPVDVHRLIGETITLLQHSLDKRIVLRQDLRARSPLTLGDTTQLQNALLNLALNARDAMPEGGELVFSTATRRFAAGDEICRRGDLKPGQYLLVGVADTGVGMDRPTQQHIFEPFYTTKGDGAGTGMGLAAVYGTVQSHSGCVEVDSELGRGSTFRLLLPLHAGEPDRLPRDRKVEPGVARAARVLVIDDEEVVGRLTEAMLVELGHEVEVCQDSVAAVAWFRESWQECNLVVLDLVMPRQSGRETFYAVREIDPTVAVVLISGYSINEEVQGMLSDGARGFLQKPFRRRDFAELINRVLATSR